MSERNYRPVTYYTGANEFAILGAGLIIGWLLANAVKRQPVSAIAKPPSPPAAGEWLHGVLWSNLAAAKISTTGPDLDLKTGAALEEILAAQASVDASAKEAYGDTFAKARATNNFDLGHQATLINDTANAFDNYFAAKAVGLVGTDISALKSLCDQLTAEGKKIPGATNTLNQVNAYLNIFNQLITSIA